MSEKRPQIMPSQPTQSLIQDLRQIIEQTRGSVAVAANYALSMMYWISATASTRTFLITKGLNTEKTLSHQWRDN